MKFVMADGSTNTTTTKARKLAQTNWVCGCCAVLGAGQRTWFIVMLLCDIHINALPHMNRSYANGSKNTTKYTSQTKHWRHNDVRAIIRRRKKKRNWKRKETETNIKWWWWRPFQTMPTTSHSRVYKKKEKWLRAGYFNIHFWNWDVRRVDSESLLWWSCVRVMEELK